MIKIWSQIRNYDRDDHYNHDISIEVDIFIFDNVNDADDTDNTDVDFFIFGHI